MMKRPSPSTLLAVTGGIGVLLLVPLPSMRGLPWHALRDATENLGHPLVFALLSALLWRFLRGRTWRFGGSWALPLALCLALGAATEWVQSLTGRDGSWPDLLGDTLGSVAGICSQIALSRHQARQPRSQVLRPGIAALLAAAIAVAPFFVTAAAYARRASLAPVFWRSDSRLLRQFAQFYGGDYPGFMVQEPLPDWRGYDYLVIDVVNLDRAPLTMHVRVHDRVHDETREDRYSAAFVLRSGDNRVRIPLEQIRLGPQMRQLQMDAIRGVGIFVVRPKRMNLLRVRSLALEKKGKAGGPVGNLYRRQ